MRNTALNPQLSILFLKFYMILFLKLVVVECKLCTQTEVEEKDDSEGCSVFVSALNNN